MKITHSIASLDPAAGGPPQVAVRLAAAQASLGHEVSILSATPASAKTAVAQMLEKVPGIEAVDQFHITDEDAANRILHQDVLHCHGVWDAVLRRAASIARKGRIPYVVTPHGMLDPWSLKQKAIKKKIALFLYFRRLLNSATFLHALNIDEADLMRLLGLTCPVEVIANGVFLEEIEPLPEKGGFYSSRPELNGDPYVLFLSRLHYKKGLDILASAFHQVVQAMPNARLVVAGPDGGARSAFVEQIRELGIEDRVHLTGPIYGSEKYEAMVDASCFCLPSRQEGFSIAILEALASGAPVLISENCHFPEVGTHDAGKVCVLSPDAVGDSLLQILQNPEVSKSYGQNARHLVRESFTWQAIAQKLLGAYSLYLSTGTMEKSQG